MITKNIVWKNRYVDSLVLMGMTNTLKKISGVKKAAVVTATEDNKSIIARQGLLTDDGQQATAHDLIIALIVEGQAEIGLALQKIEEVLQGESKTVAKKGEYFPKSLDFALKSSGGADVVLISLPGQYVRPEAEKAIRAGINTMIFSDNVSLADELFLKNLGQAHNVLVMGPDCGTSILNGAFLGFANHVRSGNIGIIGASGTGIQEVSSLLDEAGAGISQAIGIGGRDLSAQIGGISLLQALQWLKTDPHTEYIVLISKPPAPEVEEKILAQLLTEPNKFVVHFVNARKETYEKYGITFAETLEDTARQVLEKSWHRAVPRSELFPTRHSLEEMAVTAAEGLKPEQRYLRGLFSGGTFCYEATRILGAGRTNLFSNTPVNPAQKIANPHQSQEHSLIDLGADEFTVGVPHPMIDFTTRADRLMEEIKDPTVGCILFDLILGYGAHLSPESDFIAILERALKYLAGEKRKIVWVAHVCGTKNDPQPRQLLISRLESLGVNVLPTNAFAAQFVGKVIEKHEARTWIP